MSGHTAGAELRSTCVAVSFVARDLLGEWVTTQLSDTAVLVSYRSKSLGAFWDGDVRCSICISSRHGAVQRSAQAPTSA